MEERHLGEKNSVSQGLKPSDRDDFLLLRQHDVLATLTAFTMAHAPLLAQTQVLVPMYTKVENTIFLLAFSDS